MVPGWVYKCVYDTASENIRQHKELVSQLVDPVASLAEMLTGYICDVSLFPPV